MTKFIRISFFLICSFFTFASSFAAQDKVQEKAQVKLQLSGIDIGAKKFDLKDYAGKTVLVSFYSGGCTVCARDLKLMREFYRDNMAKKFMLVGVNIDKTKEEYESYAKLVASSIAKNQQFPLIWRSSATIEGFGNITSNPTHIVINSAGQVVMKREGSFKGEDWDNLWELLN